MFEQPTPPREKGPSQEWSMTYLKSICGILKIVEMVYIAFGYLAQSAAVSRHGGLCVLLLFLVYLFL